MRSMFKGLILFLLLFLGRSGEIRVHHTLSDFFNNPELTVDLYEEIQARLKKYNSANELLDIVKANPDELKSIKEILENPDHFKEIVAMNNIASSSFLYKWAKGSFYKLTRDFLFKLGDELETFVTNNIISKAPFNSLLTPPTNYLKARQVRLKPFGSTTASFWISDDLVFVNVGTMPNGKPIFEAYVNDTKLTTNAPWTNNQTEYLMKPFRDGETQLEFEVLSTEFNQLGLPVNSKVIIKKQNVFKSTSCGNNRLTNCFETNQVTNFAENLYRK